MYGYFGQRVARTWNGFPGKVVAAETGYKLKLDRCLDALKMDW